MAETPPPDPSDAGLRPGDEAPPGTPGAGENLCPQCSGSGRTGEGDGDGQECPVCAGTGRITQGVGGI
jgi:hypothetical protein